MILMNNKMANEICLIDWNQKKLPSILSEIVFTGFRKENDCFCLDALTKGKTNVTYSDFPDKTGYECFINSIHIDDFIDSNYLAYACLFVEDCFDMWRRSGFQEKLQAIISSDEFGSLVKLHIVRKGEAWVSDELEQYEESILVADSTVLTLH